MHGRAVSRRIHTIPVLSFRTVLRVGYDQTAYRSIRHEYRSRDYTLRKLGFNGSELGYDDYLNSRRWKDGGRALFQKSGRGKRCYVCGDPHYDVHHRTYKTLGRERLEHLIPLCRRHHMAVHTLAERLGRPLFYAHDVERLHYIHNRLGDHVAPMMERIAKARVTGKLGKLEAAPRLPIQFVVDDRYEDLLAQLSTERGESISLAVRFPGGVDAGQFELRQWDLLHPDQPATG